MKPFLCVCHTQYTHNTHNTHILTHEPHNDRRLVAAEVVVAAAPLAKAPLVGKAGGLLRGLGSVLGESVSGWPGAGTGDFKSQRRLHHVAPKFVQSTPFLFACRAVVSCSI
jgi:hypothetical protein